MQHRSRYGIALGAVAIAGTIVVALACNGAIASIDSPDAGVLEAGDASQPDASSLADAGADSGRAADAGVCRLVGDTCTGAGTGWNCSCSARGYPYDADAGCVGRTPVVVACPFHPLEDGNGECSGNAAIGCLMRARDGGVEAFWTPSDYSGQLSPLDDATECTKDVEAAVLTAKRCPP